jgi:hypothetical protein
VSSPLSRVDSPVCREDLVRMAAKAGVSFRSAFDWINDKAATRAANDPSNRGLTAVEIRRLAEDWVLQGNNIECVRERRELYSSRRHFHYDIIIEDLPDFPRGLYVEMELSSADENDPSVSLLNAHPPSF